MFKERKNIHIVHRCEDQFEIRCTLVHEFYKKACGWRNGRYCEWETSETYEVEEQGGYGSYYYPSMVTLFVDLLTFCNKTYGTTYEVSDEMKKKADSYRGQKQCLYNIGYEVGWKIRGEYGASIDHQYKYDDISRICEGTMGYWDKDEIIALADELVRFFKEDKPYEMVVAAMKKQYAFYDELHIGYKRDTRYVEGDVENNSDSNIQLTMLT